MTSTPSPPRKKTPYITAACLFALFLLVQLRPSEYRTVRAIELQASPEAVYRRLEDLHQWQRWSPWNELDSQIKRKYEGPRRGQGAAYSWEGRGSVGQGKVTIAEADEPIRVVYRVEFIAPWNATVQNTFQLAKSANGVKLSWAIAGRRNFWSKLFGFFGDPDEVLGTDMERGLQKLKEMVERPPTA